MRGAPRQTAGIAAPLAALAAALALAALLEYLARTPASGLVEPPPPPAAPPSELRVAGGLGWQVTAVRSAHHVLVVEVETDRLAEAGAIARQLVEPVADRYDEVLVYFYRPASRPRQAVLRIQWTPGGGYKRLEIK